MRNEGSGPKPDILAELGIFGEIVQASDPAESPIRRRSQTKFLTELLEALILIDQQIRLAAVFAGENTGGCDDIVTAATGGDRKQKKGKEAGRERV